MTTTVPAARPANNGVPYRTTPAQNLITIGLAWWLIMGLFVDGWAHNHLGDRLETFFTPWHALFYSGFLAVAAWVGWLGQRGWRAGRRGLLALPQGYELAALGVPVFALGGLGDMAWHTVFGIEVGVEALLSPTHLVLFLGAACIVSAPLVSAWRTPTARKAPPGVVWTGVLATLALLSLVSFMNMYLWGLLSVSFGAGQGRGALGSVLLTALIMTAPVLLLLRRFQLPFGSVTVIYGLNTLMMSLMMMPGEWRVPLLLLLAGLVADGFLVALRPSPARPWALRGFAFLLPMLVWAPYLGGAAVLGLSELSLELWLGISVMAGLGGVALSALVVPPTLPAEAQSA
ncbi:hypothetical protein [Deinococcus malanensis]|nr:hypothetical protein [Deinococcus malanensis]